MSEATHDGPNALARVYASDRVFGALLVLVLVEGAVLLLWNRVTGGGPPPAWVVSFLGAGAGLMAAMYLLRRVDRHPLAFAAAMLAALGFHAWHLAQIGAR